ncbi:protein serine/threonine phosphatase 2C [Dissoconium aciculare CBS 342.82]|uniref:Protein serine/threonine phosphatase 2C n=1 Tax=Dissoconium aciculare CBS 342.82 TaxID=1314786 RepID=A0A6J3MC75_9PEZI|nr:protein serine/threonine phosphatase 2C [Dissoconium aciculare CBS 342.82]KAF1824432.1 protein serine/threonine phosphatase 2C [Dissoconium aciculare CBS 342.82]
MPVKHHGVPFDCGRALRTILDDVLIQQPPLCNSPRSVRTVARQHNTSLGLVGSHGPQQQIRGFHDYFVTHLPKSSVAPDRAPLATHHKLPRSDSKPHDGPLRRSSALLPHSASATAAAPPKDTTVVRIPLKSAKHHFGAGVSRGSRPYNEDTYQAGTVELPAFATRQPVSLSLRPGSSDGNIAAPGETGDPQVFYFGVFDGHGGKECSEFLRERLHAYVEETALLFGMESSLQDQDESYMQGGVMGEQDPEDLQKSLVSSWRETVGGYFKRFKPEHFPAVVDADNQEWRNHSTIETILTYAFLKADLDFTTAQAAKHTAAAAEATKNADETRKSSSMDDPVLADRPLNDNDMLFHPEREASQNLSKKPRPNSRGSSPNLDSPIGGSTRFQGGSTASVALVSTPTPVPFWHPATASTLVVAHVGDTRVLLCRTSDGAAVPLTSNHHPSMQTEANRLRRFATSFVTDSFGEERVLGLANTRAFGDIGSKRIGVSAEPQITTTQLPPAGYAFMVLVSDGVSGHLEDQEIVDIVKDAKTPAQAAESLVSFAVEVSGDADNATALVVRLGGWERRSEGGGGSLRTKERRDFRRQEAMDPRSRRQ